jgi:hypothetical protein
MSQHEVKARFISYAIECAAAVGLVIVILYTQALAQ